MNEDNFDINDLVKIPYANIETIHISYDQFIFTTRNEGEKNHLYHGIVEE